MKMYIIALLCLATSIQGKTVFGPGTFYDTNINESLYIMGPLVASNSIIQDGNVFGPASIDTSTVGALTIHGPLNTSNSTFNGRTKVYGDVSASNCTFKSDLIVEENFAATIILTDTSVKNITITIRSGTTTKPGFFSYFFTTQQPKALRVILKGDTTVDGSITFNGVKGIIEKDDTATITGHIIGAQEEPTT